MLQRNRFSRARRGSFRNSISLDQVMAEKIGGDTRFPSLTLMIGAEMMSCSWTRSGSMIPPERSPLKLFQQLFVENTAEQKLTALRRLQEDRSLLDSLRERAKRLERSVGASDRDRLDQYFTSVRDLEKRLAKSTEWVDRPKPKVDAKAPEEIKEQHDLAKNERVMFKHAGHLAFDKKNYPLSNLYVSRLQSLGVEAASFSSGSGTMRGIELT
jgi:hypothetical protein